jgi:hypothetical protein
MRKPLTVASFTREDMEELIRVAKSMSFEQFKASPPPKAKDILTFTQFREIRPSCPYPQKSVEFLAYDNGAEYVIDGEHRIGVPASFLGISARGRLLK